MPSVCASCGREFSAKSRRRTCSKACALLAQADAAKRAANSTRIVATCRHCGSGFSRKKHGGDKRMFCSRPCSDQYRKRQSDVRKGLLAQAQSRRREQRLEQVRNRGAEEALKVEARKASLTKPCGECGVVFVAKQIRVSKCATCAKKLARRTTQHRRRAIHGRATRHEQRAKRLGLPRVYSISPVKLFDRDGWHCQICGKRTPKRLQGKQQADSPTIDHIIPFAAGGGHTWDNVQCACHACNHAKGSSVLGQLRLAV